MESASVDEFINCYGGIDSTTDAAEVCRLLVEREETNEGRRYREEMADTHILKRIKVYP